MAYADRVREWLPERAGEPARARACSRRSASSTRRRAPTSRSSSRPAAPRKKVINLCANNYLGLSSHPEVVAAAHAGLDPRGYGMSSVRFICGTQDIHRELEQKLTAFLGTEDTLLFPSCMDANAGVFEAVLSASRT